MPPKVNQLSKKMRKLLSSPLSATVVLLLFTSCSSVNADSEGVWTGTWTYQSETALLKASLVQHGDQLSGTVEQVFREMDFRE